MPTVLPPLIPELFQWLKERKIQYAGAPFFNYLKMNEEQLVIEVGIPTNSHVNGDDKVQSGSFLSGKYAIAKYTSPYNRLFDVNLAIEKWKDNNIKFKAPKVEFYPTDPTAEPNPEKWETIIINRIDES